MLQPAKKNSELFAVRSTQHRRPVELFLRLQQQRFLFTELFLNYSSSSCACVRDSVQVAPGGAENTHWNIHKSMSQGSNFLNRRFQT